MAHWKNGFFHGILGVLNKILLTEKGYNVSKMSTLSTPTQIIGDERINTQVNGENIDISCGDSNTSYITLNGQITVNLKDERIAGISAPTIEDAKEGQLYFRIVD